MNEHRILVLKSNIESHSDLLRVRQPLDMHPGIRHWNIDIEDCDHVLRIVTSELTVADIEALVRENGYQCSELD